MRERDRWIYRERGREREVECARERDRKREREKGWEREKKRAHDTHTHIFSNLQDTNCQIK